MSRHCHSRYLCTFLLTLGALAAASSIGAQPAPDPAVLAQQQYEREIASCNSGALAAPEREACIRTAGLRLDRARGLPPGEQTVTTPDGRATVVTPAGAVPPAPLPETGTSRDGRATIVR